jgi:sec-independent protein translocase protein TatA
MPGIGPMELIIVLVIALIFLGPKRLPEAGRSLGRGLREFKDSVSGNSVDDDDDGREPALAAAVSSPAGPISEAKSDAAAEPAEPAAPAADPKP